MDPRIAVRVRTVQMRRPQTTRWKKEQWNVSSASGCRCEWNPSSGSNTSGMLWSAFRPFVATTRWLGGTRRTGSAIGCGPRRPTVCSVRGNHVSTHLRGTVNKVWCRRPWSESHDRFHGRTAGLGTGGMDVPSVCTSSVTGYCGVLILSFKLLKLNCAFCAIKQFWGLGFPFLGGQGSTGHTLWAPRLLRLQRTPSSLLIEEELSTENFPDGSKLRVSAVLNQISAVRDKFVRDAFVPWPGLLAGRRWISMASKKFFDGACQRGM